MDTWQMAPYRLITNVMKEIKMNPVIEKYFTEMKIEYYSVLRYSDCREINRGIMERESFTPRSVIVFLVPYYTGETVNISRYAASIDYHIAIREISDGLISELRSKYPGASFRGYGDHSPIGEVGAALIGGLGVIGDNGLIINEKYGSYVFIGDIVTDMEPETLGAVSPMPVGECLHCGACRRACPTGLLAGEGEDCLSEMTQRKGELGEKERRLMRKYNTVWGCDICQTSCPYNRAPALTPLEFFYRERISCLTRGLLDSMDKDSFKARAFAWRGRRTLERNLDVFYPVYSSDTIGANAIDTTDKK